MMKEKIKNIRLNVKKNIAPLSNYFKKLELSGILLLTVTIISLLLANSPLGESFLHFWHTEFKFELGGFEVATDLHVIINDVLMTLFFVVVGGEIKEEIVDGALSSKEKAILPVIAAIGGMLFPALIYTFFNWGQPTARGWGIPTATDIAFSLTVISLLGKKVPFSLKIFLAALAIADDLGAIVVIALFYSASLNLYYMLGAAALLVILFGFNYLGFKNLKWYILPGILLWYAFFKAGIHPTISGVIFAIAIPFSKDVSKQHDSPLDKMLARLSPISNYCIMPLFAFANAGVIINVNAMNNIFSPISLGIIFGLMLGKSTGIWITSWIAVKLKLAQIPDDLNWKNIYGMAWVAGIGFTMSMFVTQLAFTDKQYIDTAKISILIASGLSGLIGYAVLYFLNPGKKTSI